MSRKIVAFYLVLLLLVGAFVEGAAALTTRILVRRGWMAWIPEFTAEQVGYYEAHRNPLLGWGPPVDSHGRVTRLQPRPDPVFPDSLPACVATYGESFTAGSEVGEDGTYPHILALRLGCRVANYGVGAYGSDQALMLARAQQGLDTAPVVVLGHISENILRNVNQYRNLLYPDQQLYFKPRFLLEGDSLRYLPIPVRDGGDLLALADDPERWLPHDAFVARPRRGFPHSVALVRWMTSDFHVRAQLAELPRHAPFYAADHPAGGLPLTTAILATFDREMKRAGRTPLVLLMPVGRDLVHARRTGEWPDQPLADALRAAGVEVIHAGPEMLARIGDDDPCSLFHLCTSHYNARGYRIMGEVVADHLERRGIRPAALE